MQVRKYKNSHIVLWLLSITFLVYALGSFFLLEGKERSIQQLTLTSVILLTLLFFKDLRKGVFESLLIFNLRYLIDGIAAIALLMLAIYFLSLSGDAVEIEMNDEVKVSFLIFFSAVIMSPIAEEILFREVLYDRCIKYSKIKLTMIVFISLFFAMAHPVDSFSHFMLLSFIMYMVRIKSDSVLCCIAIHSLYNFSVLFVSLYL